ncbi:hypothetical protein KI387_027504, partial [Taxus chinensis]
EVMVEVEVRASHNVLEACGHTETRQKVVFTSSMAAVAWRDEKSSVADLHERLWSDKVTMLSDDPNSKESVKQLVHVAHVSTIMLGIVYGIIKISYLK